MTYETIRFEAVDGVARLTLDRPEIDAMPTRAAFVAALVTDLLGRPS